MKIPINLIPHAMNISPLRSKDGRSIKVGLVQINNSFSGQNYLPYSLACLRSYIESHAPEPARYQFLPMIYKRLPIQEIVNRLKDADIIGFSTYVWNANISLEAARRIKISNPNTLIVFGGPQVPDKPEAFLRANPFIDIVVHNEGEKTLLSLLERLPERNWQGMTGVSYLTADGTFVKTPNGVRMKDLEELPSPFLNGMFDRLIAENPEEKWIGLWETNRGCPFQCTFCDWGSATAAKVTKFELDRLFHELEWFIKNKIEYIFVCDANFGSMKRDIEISQYVANLRSKTGYPQGFSVQSTKNATDRAYTTQKILADAGLNKGVALSMQSLDPATLENIKRDNISLETYLELSRRFTRDKVETYSDLILALPGETYSSYVEGIDTLIKTGQHNRIQFNNLSILPNAEMGDPDYLAKFKMRTVRNEIINIHGTKEILADDVAEMQDMVVETYSMNAEDWRRSRAISWMIAFLYFDKLVQIPIVLLHQLTGISHREVFERFMQVDRADFPVIGEIRDFFLAEAQSIQDGGVEYVYSEDWLGVYWPADEYAYIRLTSKKQFGNFYAEVNRLFSNMLGSVKNDESADAIREAIEINRELVSQPNVETDITVRLNYNIIDFWRGICMGEPIPLTKGNYVHDVMRSKRYYADFQRWCEEVVWWGNKKGAYLYPVLDGRSPSPISLGSELSGHY
jgi:radical SAM superfamily enzyme YgiQ (UPF0313 family)